MIPATKICRRCYAEKDRASFHSYRAFICLECQRSQRLERQKKWSASEKGRASHATSNARYVQTPAGLAMRARQNLMRRKLKVTP